MKKQIYTFVGLIIVLAIYSAAAVRAQSATTGTVHIPFDFSVRNQTIAAGDYVVNRQDDKGALWVLRSKYNRRSVTLVAAGIEPKRLFGNGKLSFRRYGNEHFLAAVETPEYRIELSKSRAEKDSENRTKNTNRLAKNDASGTTPEIVVEIAM